MDLQLFRRFTDFSCLECKTIIVHECRCIPANSCKHGYMRIECKGCFADAKHADFVRRMRALSDDLLGLGYIQLTAHKALIALCDAEGE